MLVEFGTQKPLGGRHDSPNPSVVYGRLSDGLACGQGLDVEDFRSHLGKAMTQRGDRIGITNFPGAEALLQYAHPGGAWGSVSETDPLWVWSENAEYQRQLSEFFQIPEGRPQNYEGDYWRRAGNVLLPPGVVPYSDSPKNLLLNLGAGISQLNTTGGALGQAGTGSAANSTTFTTGSTLTTNQFKGYRLYVTNSSGSTVWGNIISNNNTGGASVITVDGWYPIAVTSSGANGTTPASGYYWFVPDGGITSAWWMGITTTNISPAVTDVTMSGEATANGMGRTLASTTTASPSGGQVVPTVHNTFTYSTTGALTFYAMGLFTSAVKSSGNDGVCFFFETSFSGSFTVTNSGDQATVTDTITIS